MRDSTDAISTALGLEQVSDALQRLTEYSKSLNADSQELAKRKRELIAVLGHMDDERAGPAVTLLRQRTLDLAALRELATGSSGVDASLQAIRQLRDLRLPADTSIAEAREALSLAISQMARAGDEATSLLKAITDMKSEAVQLHHAFGDMPCPVCAVGRLDGEWATAARETILDSQHRLAVLVAASDSLRRTREDARRLLTPVPEVLDVSAGEELEPYRSAARAAWQAWAEVPRDDAALLRHLAELWVPLAEAVGNLSRAADKAVQAREDRWSPIASSLAEFVEIADRWERGRPAADDAKAALAWLKDNDLQLKNERVKPIADAAAEIWEELRQESNVSVSGLSLEGRANRRHVDIPASVDGENAAALAVMSQGELHALALALFLPRATAAASPFRFVVLDDPVQAMDPAKVDGLVTVLSRIAADRQVIVFSHDDRLSTAVRRAPVDAQILEVKREAGSKVSVVNTFDPPRRYLRDAMALVRDAELPEATKRQVLSGLLRMALEAACKDRYFSNELAIGHSRDEVEERWGLARTTSQRMWLAVTGATVPQERWLAKVPSRKRALGVCTSALHQGLRGDPEEACHDVERLVDDVREGVR